jgi:hypothetical protein
MKSKIYSFRLLAVCLVVSCFSQFSNAQEVYWGGGEGFQSGFGWPSAVPWVPTDVVSTKSGTWRVFLANRTNGATGGTGTCPSLPHTDHARFYNFNSYIAQNPALTIADSGYFITPIVYSGIKELHFARTRAGRRFTVYYTTDEDAATANWILAGQSTTTISALCADSTWNINQDNAKRLKIVARSGTDTDMDSLWLVSMRPILPVKFAGVSAANVNGFTKVSWKIATEVNTHSYIVEKSTNGASFKNSGEVVASNAGSYSWIDNAAAAGTAFYRIKAVDKDGKLTYSSVVKVSSKAGRPEFVIAPNVVRGRTLNLQINNVEKGNVELQVSNNGGQVVYRTSFMNEGGSSVSKTIQLPYSLTTGTYRVQMVTSGTVLTQTAILQ